MPLSSSDLQLLAERQDALAEKTDELVEMIEHADEHGQKSVHELLIAHAYDVQSFLRLLNAY